MSQVASNASYNFSGTIDSNRDKLAPPVMNMMFHNEGPLKLMVVGGPNSRRDYHLNQGEELFYQLEGDMCLKVMEQGSPKDVVIRQGEFFILPGCIPHSPQRFENTVGLVIERERHPTQEFDGLRYYVDDTNATVLWQRWFHCVNLAQQLGPVIKAYHESEAHQTKVPTAESVEPAPWAEDTGTMLRAPFPLAARFAELRPGGRSVKLDSRDYVVELVGNGSMLPAMPITTECWILQLEGESVANGDKQLRKGSAVLLPQGLSEWDIGEAFAMPASPTGSSVTSPALGAGGAPPATNAAAVAAQGAPMSGDGGSPAPAATIALLVYCINPMAHHNNEQAGGGAAGNGGA